MDTIKHLQAIGLSEKAAEIYLALLQMGSGSVHDISKRAGVIRTTCYPLLEELQRRELVSTTRSGKKILYVAESPQKLIDEAERTVSVARGIAPTLTHILAGNAKRPKIQIHEGISGVWRAYENVIAGEHHEVKAFVPADEAIAMAGDRKVKEYIRKRVKKNISIRAILPKTPLIEKEYTKYNKGDLRESRFIDPKKFPMPVEIDLYDKNKIAIMSFRDGIGMIIESDSIYQALDSMFELIWLSSESSHKKN